MTRSVISSIKLKSKTYLGCIYLKRKNYPLALECFCSAYQLSPEDAYLKDKIAEVIYRDIRRQLKCQKL